MSRRRVEIPALLAAVAFGLATPAAVCVAAPRALPDASRDAGTARRPTRPLQQSGRGEAARGVAILPYAGSAQLLRAPVSSLFPGAAGPAPQVENPVEEDAAAVERGMGYFDQFNCSGCHAANAGGGMGPSLSNRFFAYGGAPQNIYLSIYQGRPNGMPSWGGVLPENMIWDLVAYIHSISRDPSRTWGQTMSHEAFAIEQVPAEFVKTATPWAQVQRFGFGRKPSEKRPRR